MNRRGLLQRLMALPAALLGIKALEKEPETVTWRATYGVGEATATEVTLQQQWEREAEHAFYDHDPRMYCWYRFDPPVRIG